MCMTDLGCLDKAVEEGLSALGDAFSLRLKDKYGAAPPYRYTAVQATQYLLRRLHGEGWNLNNTSNPHNLANYSLTEVISKRCGTACAVGLILRWILLKVDVEASLLDLRRVLLLRVTEQDGRMYCFNLSRLTGKALTAQDCRSFVPHWEWDDSFLEPNTPIAILTRMLRDIQYSVQRGTMSVRMELLLERSQHLLNAMNLGQTHVDVRYEVAPLTLDPEVYREYGLLH
jgi:regulator of sirC expression with transglutaminase-like and TPR domain